MKNNLRFLQKVRMPLGRTESRYNARTPFLYIWILKNYFRATCAIWLSRCTQSPTTRDFSFGMDIRKRVLTALVGFYFAFKAYLPKTHKKVIFYAEKCKIFAGVDNFLKNGVKCNGQFLNFGLYEYSGRTC